MTKHRWAEAYVHRGVITIKVPASVLGEALKQNPRDDTYADWKVTSLAGFASDVVRALNYEAEDGTTAIYELFDKAVIDAIEQGSEHIEEP